MNTPCYLPGYLRGGYILFFLVFYIFPPLIVQLATPPLDFKSTTSQREPTTFRRGGACTMFRIAWPNLLSVFTRYTSCLVPVVFMTTEYFISTGWSTGINTGHQHWASALDLLDVGGYKNEFSVNNTQIYTYTSGKRGTMQWAR